jgi:hypothetical protein
MKKKKRSIEGDKSRSINKKRENYNFVVCFSYICRYCLDSSPTQVGRTVKANPDPYVFLSSPATTREPMRC